MSGKIHELSPDAVFAEYSDVSYDLPATAITPTAGAPFVLAACFPIVFTPEGGSTVTITAEDAGDLDIQSQAGYNGFQVFYGGSVVFTTSSGGRLDEYPDGTTFNGEPVSFDDAFLGFTPTYALSDRTTNLCVITVAQDPIVFKLPAAAVSGKARDFFLRIDLTASGANVANVSYMLADGTTAAPIETPDGSLPTIENGKVTILYFFEQPKGANASTFCVKADVMQTAQSGGAS